MFSIIVPTWNREAIVTETLDSVRRQSLSEWECIVVDDHSTDGTYAVLQTYAQMHTNFHVFLRPEGHPKGPASCRNFGLANAKGDKVLFLDSDDILDVNCLRLIADSFESDILPSADCALLRTDDFTINPSHPFYSSPRFQADKGSVIDQILAWNIVHNWNMGFVWNRAFLESNKAQYPEEMMVLEDIVFSYELICSASKCLYVDAAALIHLRKKGADSLARSIVRNLTFARMNVSMLRRLYDTCERSGKMNSYVQRHFIKRFVILEMSLLFAGFTDPAKEIRDYIIQRGVGGLGGVAWGALSTIVLWIAPMMRVLGRARVYVRSILKRS